jgi:phosphate/sulfate permease
MAMGSGTTMKIIVIVLAVLGIGLAIWGYQLSGSVGSKITQAVTGSDTDKVMTFYIAGAVSIVVGIYLFIKN